MLPDVSMARTSSTSTSCGPVADGNVGGNGKGAAGAAAKPASGPMNASKALAAIALNDALTFRRMIRPPQLWPLQPKLIQNQGQRQMDDLSFSAHQSGCAKTLQGPS